MTDVTVDESVPFTLSSVCLRQQDLGSALSTTRRLGFASIDLVGLRGLCEHVPVNGTRADLRAAARTVLRSGLRASSVNADPGSFDGHDDPDEVRRRIDQLLGFVVDAGVPLLVLPCGEKTARPGDLPETARMAEEINRVAETASRRGVRVAIEAPYFGRPVNDLARTDALCAALDPAVGLAFDVSHIEAADESVVAAWDALRERVAIVHLRDAASGDIRRVIGAGRVDFGALFGRIDASAFDGDVVLELETRDGPYATKQDEVRAAVAHLTAICEKQEIAS